MSTQLNLAMPGNPRYQPKSLQKYFGYDNNFGPLAEVEIATMRTLAEIGVIPQNDISLLTPELEAKLLAITTTSVDERERKVTKHDIRAWVQLAQEILPEQLRRWVHVPLTSYDALDTARTLQFVRAHNNVVLPLIVNLIDKLGAKALHYSETVQIGRTHGQHALPITVGFWLSTILARLLHNATEMERFSGGLVGKISGAVGAYNAQVGFGITEMCEGGPTFEERVLSKLCLRPGIISTQVIQPEPLAYYLFSVTAMSAALAQLGRDCRHLMRTEIGEISEPFAEGQVGSSIMAHKRNPINFENEEGMWFRTQAEFSKVFATLISEHQRDLVGSSLLRDFPAIIVNLVQQLETILRVDAKGKSFVDKITVDETSLQRNLTMQNGLIMAEPIYIALQMAGYTGDAHELVNHRAVPMATKNGYQLRDAILELSYQDKAVKEAVERIPPHVWRLLRAPGVYVGLANEKTLEVCHFAKHFVLTRPSNR